MNRKKVSKGNSKIKMESFFNTFRPKVQIYFNGFWYSAKFAPEYWKVFNSMEAWAQNRSNISPHGLIFFCFFLFLKLTVVFSTKELGSI